MGSFLGWVVLALVLAGVALWVLSKRASSYSRVHPDLRSPLLRFRSPSFTPTLVSLMQKAPSRFALPTDVQVEARKVTGVAGQPDVPVYVYRPSELRKNAPALVYIHGGGYIVGSAGASHDICARYARELGIVVVNVDYRLAPKTPFPGPLEDCYVALLWATQHAAELGIDAERIAVSGESAGAGLAAALAQLAHDRDEVRPVFQLLIYPMLDDRTVLRHENENRGEFVWNPASNRLGWTSYLGRAPTLEAAPDYAAPARRDDLTGLPPAWIGVGTLDLFYPEDEAYARRLNEAGVSCDFYEAKGAYHGFDMMQPGRSPSAAFRRESLQALRRGLGLS